MLVVASVGIVWWAFWYELLDKERLRRVSFSPVACLVAPDSGAD